MNLDRSFRWVGVVSLGLASVALWRTESHAQTARPVSAPSTPVNPEVARDEAPTVRVAAPAAQAPAPTAVATPATPTPIARPISVEPAPLRSGEVRVRRFEVALGVDHREPTNTSDHFSLAEAGHVYGFVDADNRSDHPTAVVISFRRQGSNADVGQVQLDVPATHRFRTWGFTRMIRAPGTWTATVSTLDGQEITHRVFEVTGS